ncbi:MAG: hypothetical protein ACK2T3_10750, partial [Candidatus Promineifilaceae bacterium]
MRNGTRINRAFGGLSEQSRPYRMGILALCLLAICAALLVACKSDEDKLTSTVQEGLAESLPTLAKSASLDVTVVDTPSPTNTSVPVPT